MNRHCHRIVFNARRGALMAVAETTTRCGKHAAGEGAAPRTLAWILTASMLLLSPAGAQIIADPNAPSTQRPTILSDSLGRPLIHIQTPNAQGLSRNTYSQFDVPTIGIVLNNSASNPWIASKTPASTILNEVNSTSHIKGLESDYLAHKLAHALAGCAAGALMHGTCKSGAIGAAVGEVVAGLMPPANGIAYSDSEKHNVLALSKIVAGATAAYAGGNAQTAITTAETAVQNNALVPVLIGLAWLADKAWTAYEVSQDVAAIRDGTKTVEQVALEKGEEYVTGIVLGNVARYGVKAVKVGGTWVQSKDPFSQVVESRSAHVPNAGAVGNIGAFLKSPGFGAQLGEASQKTSKQQGPQSVYKVNENINEYLKKGDQFYLDNMHKNHIEVFDSTNKFKAVLNLDGSLNPIKTAAAQSQGRTIQK